MRRLLLALAFVACSDPYVPPPPPDGARACDPLAIATRSIALASVTAAGRDKDGVVYLVDEMSSQGWPPDCHRASRPAPAGARSHA